MQIGVHLFLSLTLYWTPFVGKTKPRVLTLLYKALYHLVLTLLQTTALPCSHVLSLIALLAGF
jgi:hypothetical protein